MTEAFFHKKLDHAQQPKNTRRSNAADAHRNHGRWRVYRKRAEE